MEEIELSIQLTNIIMHGVSSVESNIKWNGMDSQYFRPYRGIQHGGLIYPYIFVLCLDKRSHIIMHAMDQGDWKPIKAGKYGSLVSHLINAPI